MDVVIRADSSVDIGSGHVMRCLTLADQLTAVGARVTFLCRPLPGAMIQGIEHRGHVCRVLPAGVADSASDAGATLREIDALAPQGVDWVVVDHYGLDAAWEARVRPYARRVMVIDDLADRRHDCDLLLDQNYYRDMLGRYGGLVSDDCRLLLGPQHVLLRQEFVDARKGLRVRDGYVRRIFVSFGASDPTGETVKALRGLASSSLRNAAVDVVVGAANPQRHQIASVAAELPDARLHVQVYRMAELIAAADLGLGAGGATTWERCFLGLPTLTVITAPNQARMTRDLGDLGVIRVLGEAQLCQPETYGFALTEMAAQPQHLRSMGQACLQVVPNPPTAVGAELLALEANA
jgi:UDP-2,4-diacetamido-2,4,6-trideoxy-beta-L-altropyranose hydrolase